MTDILLIKRKELVLAKFNYIFLLMVALKKNHPYPTRQNYIYLSKYLRHPPLSFSAYPYLLFQDSPGTKPLSPPPPTVQVYISIPQVVSPLLLGSRGNSHL